MAYADQLQSSLKYLIAAGEVGRRSLDDMLGPLTGAVGDMTGAASELENIPFLGPALGEKLQRTMRGISAAQSKVGQVAAIYGQATSAAAQVQERLGTLKEQASKAGAAINRVAGNVSPALGNIVPTGSFAAQMTPAPEAVKPFPHLLIIQPLKPESQPYYFNLDTAAFDELRRQTAFRWAGQERLTRSIAQQAVGLGDDKLSLKGAIFPGFKGGLKQLDTLRSMGRNLQPLSLTTGYGEVLGNWCLLSVDEEQSNLLAGGIPRKQGFSLEFVSYGDDLQNV
ncbi:phage tail protein [Pseudomonas syringae pv. syringae]|uniref:phage tail protein n=1 Tax=Pseudomonas syringae TaxID=317 RepID=UPI001659CC0D|nr:phage tail protein [Pseudomonas syringae]MBC9745052.1 phage tail protein [Pseudomonas syringae pv. syringae]MBC9749360.1 phage tail protein [Pseudomonas syringae pv. syringae]MCK9724254.1 phage tail protein [Pseudomonas syringae pv. syringae]